MPVAAALQHEKSLLLLRCSTKRMSYVIVFASVIKYISEQSSAGKQGKQRF